MSDRAPLLLNVIEVGQGPAVALLHGLFGRAQNLGGVARRLAGSHRVFSLDLRNHGASPHAAGMDYDLLAADVLHTLAARDALPVSLLGHSMGGKTAMHAALAAPGQVTRLLVGDIAPVPYEHNNSAIAGALLRVRLAAGMTRADAGAQLADAIPDANIRAFLLQNFLPGASPGWRIGITEIAEAISDIEGFSAPFGAVYGGPSLFVRGEGSDYVLPAHRAAIEALFSDARVVTVRRAGHWLHADQPEIFGDIAVAFMAGRM